MFNVLPDINWFAVIASTAVFAVLGGLYYSVIIAKPYRVALGNEDRELPKPGPVVIVGPLIASLAIVITTAILLHALSVETLGDGIAFGVIVAIGYLVAQTMTIAINPNFPRPFLYTAVNAPYFIVCTVSAAAILTVWR